MKLKLDIATTYLLTTMENNPKESTTSLQASSLPAANIQKFSTTDLTCNHNPQTKMPSNPQPKCPATLIKNAQGGRMSVRQEKIRARCAAAAPKFFLSCNCACLLAFCLLHEVFVGSDDVGDGGDVALMKKT
jgi:hypothetical protein